MEKHYLVGDASSELGDQDLIIVIASSPQEAIAKFGKEVGIKEEAFLEDLYEKSMNFSFAEQFWLQTAEEKQRFQRTGEIYATPQVFENRVRKFFGDRSDFADLYLAFHLGNTGVKGFPKEMLLYAWLNSDWSDLMVLDVSKIKRI